MAHLRVDNVLRNHQQTKCLFTSLLAMLLHQKTLHMFQNCLIYILMLLLFAFTLNTKHHVQCYQNCHYNQERLLVYKENVQHTCYNVNVFPVQMHGYMYCLIMVLTRTFRNLGFCRRPVPLTLRWLRNKRFPWFPIQHFSSQIQFIFSLNNKLLSLSTVNFGFNFIHIFSL